MTAPPREPLIDAIRHAINCHSAENASNTPDYILARFLGACLAAFNTATQQRETWYGRDARPSLPAPSAEPPAQAATDDGFDSWWRASKYCQVVCPERGWEQIARDGYRAGVERQAREIARLDTRNRELCYGWSSQNERAERAEAERDALRADAERYRWLRDGDGPQSSRWSRWRIEHWASPGPTWADIRGADLDAAIDAHLKGKP